MELCYKPDLERARTYWRAFWQHEIIDRPCVVVTAPLETRTRGPVPYMSGFRDELGFDGALAAFDEYAAGTYYGGEAIPYYEISFGPDQFSGFLGAELVMAKDRATSWVVTCIDDWASTRFELREDNPLWRQMRRFYRQGAAYGEGKFLLTVLDLHSHLDCLGAMRGAERLCMDLIDRPGEVEAALQQVRGLYRPMYEALYADGDMARRGSLGWAPFYTEGKFATIQCDYICLISPRQARRFAIPAIEEEANYLDHCVYHFDGPERAGAPRRHPGYPQDRRDPVGARRRQAAHARMARPAQAYPGRGQGPADRRDAGRGEDLPSRAAARGRALHHSRRVAAGGG